VRRADRGREGRFGGKKGEEVQWEEGRVGANEGVL
jgi:hypothetical protein